MKRAGWNPTKRNRNIGTIKQGFKQDNMFTIPQPTDTSKFFYEHFKTAVTKSINVHKKKIPVIIEQLFHDNFYSCTPLDVEFLLNQIPEKDFEDFGIIIFRQPKRKENILSSAWGRLIYSFKYKDDYYPAIILEAIPNITEYKYPKKQSIEEKLEFELLVKDGLKFIEKKREFVSEIDEDKIRSIQLYRTLFHEIGHYVHYLNMVERPDFPEEKFDDWNRRHEYYLSIPVVEKEKYANNYAVKIKNNLIRKKIIPFNRIV